MGLNYFSLSRFGNVRIGACCGRGTLGVDGGAVGPNAFLRGCCGARGTTTRGVGATIIG